MTDTHELTITRIFEAPRKLVFRAGIDPPSSPAGTARAGCTLPGRPSSRPRPGGRWRLTMVNDTDGAEYPTGGVFHEVVEPERLVFTWGDLP